MEQFTVIVPTLNRSRTLAHTLETCVAQQDEHFRILVSDNVSEDDTRGVIREFQGRDRRVESIRPSQRLAMAEHYEFALDHVPDGFLIIIGSDDGLLPGAIPRAREILRENPGALSMHAVHGAMFHYPEFQGEDSGLLHLRITPRFERRQAREWLGKVARSECHIGELPIPYMRAFNHKSLFDAIRRKTGRYVHSPIPDFSLAAGISSVVDEYLFVNPGFAITGLSPAGTGASMIYPGANRGVEAQFFAQNTTDYHPLVKYTRSELVIMGEVLLQARDAGLLPADFPISWDKIVARAYLQLQTARWDDDERLDGLEALRILARNMDCEHVLDAATRAPSLRAWTHGLPFRLDWHDDPWDFIFDTRPFGVSGIHEAARLAGTLMQAAESAGRSGLNVRDAASDGALKWAVLKMAEQNAALRVKIQSLTGESERRAAERDRAKEKLAEVTARKDRLRAKARNGNRSHSWFSKIMRRRGSS